MCTIYCLVEADFPALSLLLNRSPIGVWRVNQDLAVGRSCDFIQLLNHSGNTLKQEKSYQFSWAAKEFTKRCYNRRISSWWCKEKSWYITSRSRLLPQVIQSQLLWKAEFPWAASL